MNLIARGESQLLDSGTLGLGQLHIGASDTICRYLLVPYLKQFHQRFPNVPIKVTNATSIQCVELLEQRKVDLIVTDFQTHSITHTDRKPYATFPTCLPSKSQLHKPMKQEIAFSELNKYPIMMLDRNSTTSEFLHNLFLAPA